ncbi:MAG: hypothetical protein ACK5N8_06210 [Alphaproteobacteria bacterium]
MVKKTFKSMSILQKLLTIATIGLVIFWTIPLFILFFIGFLPTFAAFLTNKRNKNQLITICCFNIASVIPYTFRVFENFTVDSAINIVTNVLSLIVIFGLPGIGLFLFNQIPNIATNIAKTRTKAKLKEIDKNLEKLGEEWGDKNFLEKISPKK